MSVLDSVKKLHQIFLKNGWTLAVAESCTGGMLSHIITEVPGASMFFLGGIIAYDVGIKKGVLEVPEEVIESSGVVSADCAIAMARAARRLFGATYSLSSTGNLGPGAQGGRPVGEVYIGFSGPEGEEAWKLSLLSDRRENKAVAVKRAIELVLSKLG